MVWVGPPLLARLPRNKALLGTLTILPLMPLTRPPDAARADEVVRAKGDSDPPARPMSIGRGTDYRAQGVECDERVVEGCECLLYRHTDHRRCRRRSTGYRRW